MTRAFLAAALLSAVAGIVRAQTPAMQVPLGPSRVMLTTFDQQRISATLEGLDGGRLVLKGAAVASIPLEDVIRIELDHPGPNPTLDWLGQDNHDLVQVGAAAAGNGTQDMHLRLRGLAYAKKLKQVVISCRYPGQMRVWRLDPSRTPHWRIGVEREEGTADADLYLEPNAKDAFGLKFNASVTYDDDSKMKVDMQATTHTSEQLKLGAGGNAAVPSATGSVVYLEGEDILSGKIQALNDESLIVETVWNKKLVIPGLAVRGFRFDNSLVKNAAMKFDLALRHPDREDTVLVAAGDGSITAVTGAVQSLEGGKLSISYESQNRVNQADGSSRLVSERRVRTIGQPRVIGVVLAARPTTKRAGIAAYQVFRLASGELLSGRWTTVGPTSLGLAARWGANLEVPRGMVREVLIRNGKLVYLSDLEPSAVEEVPYFGRKLAYQRDRGLQGGTLTVKGKKYAKGLSVHSRCVLSFEMDGRFTQFSSLLGFEDTPPAKHGRVSCRVLADGKPVFTVSDLRADQPPAMVDAKIAGARELTLEVDYGQDEDVGDRVVWADAKLVRGG